MNRRLATPAAVLLLTALLGSAGPAAAGARDPGFVPGQVLVKFGGQPGTREVKLPSRVGVGEAVAALRRNPRVAYAMPNYIATASTTPVIEAATDLPNDPGTLAPSPDVPGAWVTKQWNFLPWEALPGLPASPGGIDATGAWKNLAAVGRPGAKGVTIAVLDTGIAYRAKGSRFRRSPDFTAGQFVKGYDFVAGNAVPLDENGHGTHVAGTIAEKTNNGIGLTGLAYQAKLMPVRVLDQHGRGKASDIAKGIRFAVNHGAQVINMSFNFGCGKKVPDVAAALSQAFAKGVVAVASAGNLGSETCVSPPATIPHVIGVGGTTEGACLGDYSLAGEGIDVVAPGGGTPVVGCPSVAAGPIYQVTLKAGSTREFGIPSDYVGTSMAAAHVSGVAAMILASGLIAPKTSPPAVVRAVTRRLQLTARNLGLPTTEQGAGLIDAAEATNPAFVPAGPAASARSPGTGLK
jgi:serine protease